jgi:hypothetical protein
MGSPQISFVVYTCTYVSDLNFWNEFVCMYNFTANCCNEEDNKGDRWDRQTATLYVVKRRLKKIKCILICFFPRYYLDNLQISRVCLSCKSCWLIDYFLHIYAPLSNFSLICRRHLWAYAERSIMPLSRKGPLSCHTCCDTGPWYFLSHPKYCLIQQHTRGCRGRVLNRVVICLIWYARWCQQRSAHLIWRHILPHGFENVVSPFTYI